MKPMIVKCLKIMFLYTLKEKLKEGRKGSIVTHLELMTIKTTDYFLLLIKIIEGNFYI